MANNESKISLLEELDDIFFSEPLSLSNGLFKILFLSIFSHFFTMILGFMLFYYLTPSPNRNYIFSYRILTLIGWSVFLIIYLLWLGVIYHEVDWLINKEINLYEKILILRYSLIPIFANLIYFIPFSFYAFFYNSVFHPMLVLMILFLQTLFFIMSAYCLKKKIENKLQKHYGLLWKNITEIAFWSAQKNQPGTLLLIVIIFLTTFLNPLYPLGVFQLGIILAFHIKIPITYSIISFIISIICITVPFIGTYSYHKKQKLLNFLFFDNIVGQIAMTGWVVLTIIIFLVFPSACWSFFLNFISEECTLWMIVLVISLMFLLLGYFLKKWIEYRLQVNKEK